MSSSTVKKSSSSGMVYGALPTSEEQKQNLERIKQAQDYLASHRIKELYSKLVYELIVHRPNHAFPTMVERLKQIKESGMDAPTVQKPRLIGIISDLKEDFEIHQAIKHIATDMNMKIINTKNFPNLAELKVEIEEYMDISNYRDFILINYPQTIADVVNTEQEINEFDMCLHFRDEQAPQSDISDQQIALQYFDAVSKCKIVSVTKSSTEEQIHEDIKRIINNRN